MSTKAMPRAAAAEVIALRVRRNLLIAVWLSDKASVIELLKGENDSRRNSYRLTVFPQRQPTMLLDSMKSPFPKTGPDWSIRLHC
jgi:hypothetical protein